jgi:DNA-binding transcriptional LysR family regulator
MARPHDLLEPDAVHAFGVFADHLNFTTAAARLHLSQPSLHAKIRKLQSGLGVDLYERDGRGLRLTTAGQRLAGYAKDCARRADDLVGDLTSAPAPVMLAAGRGTFRWVLGEGVRRLTRAGRPLSVLVADRQEALTALDGGRVDLAVVAHDPPPPHLRSEVLARYPQVLLVPRRSRLATAGEVGLRDLAGLALVVPPVGRPHRSTLDRALGEAAVRWTVAAEVDGWDLLTHFAALGLGAAVVNGCVRAPAGLVALPVRDLPQVSYWAAWRPQREDLALDTLTQLRPEPAGGAP